MQDDQEQRRRAAAAPAFPAFNQRSTAGHADSARDRYLERMSAPADEQPCRSHLVASHQRPWPGKQIGEKSTVGSHGAAPVWAMLDARIMLPR